MAESWPDSIVLQALSDLAACGNDCDAGEIALRVPAHLQAIFIDAASRRPHLRRYVPTLIAAVPCERLIESLGTEKVSRLYWSYLR